MVAMVSFPKVMKKILMMMIQSQRIIVTRMQMMKIGTKMASKIKFKSMKLEDYMHLIKITLMTTMNLQL